MGFDQTFEEGDSGIQTYFQTYQCTVYWVTCSKVQNFHETWLILTSRYYADFFPNWSIAYHHDVNLIQHSTLIYVTPNATAFFMSYRKEGFNCSHGNGERIKKHCIRSLYSLSKCRKVWNIHAELSTYAVICSAYSAVLGLKLGW